MPGKTITRAILHFPVRIALPCKRGLPRLPKVQQNWLLSRLVYSFAACQSQRKDSTVFLRRWQWWLQQPTRQTTEKEAESTAHDKPSTTSNLSLRRLQPATQAHEQAFLLHEAPALPRREAQYKDAPDDNKHHVNFKPVFE